MTIRQAPYLRQQRTFPTDSSQALAVELDKMYIDVAQRVNDRTIGIFPVNFTVSTGESYYFSGQRNKQQSSRQIFQFTGAGSIPHGLTWASVSKIGHQSYGSYTDGTSWYGVIYASSVPIAGQVSFYVTSTNIVILVDGGAPAVTSGYIDLEIISIV